MGRRCGPIEVMLPIYWFELQIESSANGEDVILPKIQGNVGAIMLYRPGEAASSDANTTCSISRIVAS